MRTFFFRKLIIGLSLLAVLALSLALLDLARSATHAAGTSGTRTIVTSLSDRGAGSLRQAILDAAPGSSIIFANTLKGTITLTSGDLALTKNLTIRGPGASVLSISGSYKSRIFSIAPNVTAIISGVSLIDGSVGGSGGGIYNRGILTLEACTIADNQAAQDGGGIVNEGTLTMMSCTVSHNNASRFGGGIAIDSGTAAIKKSIVTGNTAFNNGGGIDNSTTLLLDETTVSNNNVSASSNFPSLDGRTTGSGGGIDNQGTATVYSCLITGNRGTRDGGGIENGSAQYIHPSKLTVIHSIIAHNSASGVGGGIHTGGLLVTVNDSTLTGNSAVYNGGGIDSGTALRLNDSTVSGNMAGSIGGGVNVGGGGNARILRSTIDGNTANNAGGNLFNLNGSAPIIALQDSIVAGGHAPQGPDIYGLVLMFADGYNLIQDPSGAGIRLGHPRSIYWTGVDPKLGPLQNNGGSTPTQALLPGSPASDVIPCDPATTPPDQRGFKRPDGNETTCDVGAYES